MEINNDVWRILLIDDDEDDFLLTENKLQGACYRECSLEWAPTFDAGWNLLRSNNYDAVLIDYDLGCTSGIDLIRAAVAEDYPAPLILFTGRGNHDVDLEAMRAGATMYLTKKEATSLLLERMIRYAIEFKRNKEALRVSNQMLSKANPSQGSAQGSDKREHERLINARKILMDRMTELERRTLILQAQTIRMQEACNRHQ